MIQSAITFIDTIQGAKTSFVNTFITNEEIKKPLTTFINAQTSFAKKMVQETTNFYTTVGSSAATFDTKKAFSGI
jgi:hypothetical protein